MMRSLRLPILFAGALAWLLACDDGTRAETLASNARDSALAHDLQLASGDTTATGSVRTVSESPGALGESAPPSAAAATARNVSSAIPSAEGYIGPSCASPAPADQRRCLLGYLERSDAKLDRNYQALISHLKSEAGTRRGAAEPLTVQRLRGAQRAWVVYRDDECRKRTVEEEGPLWAPVRAKCLAEYSALRTRELEDALAKRKAVSSRPAPTKSKQASRSKRARSSKRRG
jgi:uncharacterized protein YecT (DUF1311 family)